MIWDNYLTYLLSLDDVKESKNICGNVVFCQI